MELKKILKQIKMNESTITSFLGVVVILIIGVLVYNYFKDLRPGDTSLNGSNVENSETKEEKYVVERGDTLWSIAEKYYDDGFKWSEIARANNITNSDIVTTGTELVIPNLSEDAETNDEIAQATEAPKATPIVLATPTETVSPTATPSVVDTKKDEEVKPEETSVKETITDSTYTVTKGDNLWDIAVRAYGNGFKWSEIAKANKLENPRIIHSGNVLALPR